MSEFENRIMAGSQQQREGLPLIAGSDGRLDAFVSKAASRRLTEAVLDQRRIEVALDIVASGYGYSRAVRGSRRGR